MLFVVLEAYAALRDRAEEAQRVSQADSSFSRAERARLATFLTFWRTHAVPALRHFFSLAELSRRYSLTPAAGAGDNIAGGGDPSSGSGGWMSA